MEYTAEAMGQVIRAKRESLKMSQEDLGTEAGYGKGAGVSLSRIEAGLTRPGELRLAGIARALGLTPEQLKDEAAAYYSASAHQRNEDPPKNLREQMRETKARHAALQATIEERTKVVQELGEAFNEVHDAARDDFFMKFVSVAERIDDAPDPAIAADTDIDTLDDGSASDAAIRIEAMSAGIAQAIVGGVEGAVAGAAVGGAAAYGAFTAAAMFGTASTGTAISTLSGVAATNATFALLGGGTLAAGGAGMAGGALLLTGMVAAPAALLAAGGFFIIKRRRNKQEDERLRAQLDLAERSLEDSQAGFDAIVDVLPRATEILEYVSVHGTHALTKWTSQLPPEPRTWETLSQDARGQYESFLTVAACLLSISSINVSALLTVDGDKLGDMVRVVNDTIDYADKTVRALV